MEAGERLRGPAVAESVVELVRAILEVAVSSRVSAVRCGAAIIRSEVGHERALCFRELTWHAAGAGMQKMECAFWNAFHSYFHPFHPLIRRRCRAALLRRMRRWSAARDFGVLNMNRWLNPPAQFCQSANRRGFLPRLFRRYVAAQIET